MAGGGGQDYGTGNTISEATVERNQDEVGGSPAASSAQPERSSLCPISFSDTL